MIEISGINMVDHITKPYSLMMNSRSNFYECWYLFYCHPYTNYWSLV